VIKRSSEILADKNRKISGKGKIWEIFHGLRKFFGKRGVKSETGEKMHHCLRGDGRP